MKSLSKLGRGLVKGANTVELLLQSDPLLLSWLSTGDVGRNWGDKLTPYLVSKLTSRRIVQAKGVFNLFGCPIHYVIGSGLGAALGRHANVWGPGFNSFSDKVVERRMVVHAVRGPLSCEKLLDAGVSCPEVFGDPALLAPRFLKPSMRKRYDLGIVAHFSHRRMSFFAKSFGEQVLSIDIMGNIEDVVEQVTSCSFIASSSLHGIIAADAYGIPAKWLRIDGSPIGDGFKFRDHLAAVGRESERALAVDESTSLQEVNDAFHDYSPPKLPDLNKLLEACPFLDSAVAKSNKVLIET